MADIDLKTETPDTTLPSTGFLFGADSQAAASPSVYSTQAVATALLGSTSLTGATVTTSQPVLDLTQTWNASGVTFTGLKANFTDTASAALSRLIDLQVGGSSRVYATKAGDFRVASSYVLDSDFSNFTAGSLRFNLDTFLTRRGAANLRLGAADAAAPVAQTLSVQSVVAGTSNTAGANLTITGSQGTGTGAGGSIIFQVAPAGSSGTAQNALATALTIGADRKVTISGSATGIIFDNSVSGRLICSAASAPSQGMMTLGFGPGFNGVGSTSYAFSTNPGVVSADLVLERDAANTLALRNGTNAQTFNVYNTFTSSTNFERFRIFAQSGAAVLIGTEKGSAGGTARALELQTDGTTRLTIAATTGNITTTGLVSAATGNNSSITYGASGTSDGFTILGGNVTGIVSAGQYAVYIQRGVDAAVKIRPDDGFGWGTTTADSATTLVLRRDSNNVLAQRNGANAQESRIYGSFTATDNFQRMSIKTLRESSGALSGATYVSTIAIPAYAVPVGVTTRVTTAITGATSYDVGDGTDADLWGNDIDITLGSQSRTADFTAIAAVDAAATARTVTLTANGSNFTGGVVEICVHYLTTEAD